MPPPESRAEPQMTGVFNRIMVLYPRGLNTGGPEALHQLVDELRRQGQDATLVPLRETAAIARVAAFAEYDAPETDQIDDSPGNAVIAPEGVLDRLRDVRRAQRVCWWLSIDSSAPFFPRQETKDRRFTDALGVRHVGWSPNIASAAYRRIAAHRPRRALLDSALHLTQSAYARAYLQTHLGISGTMVTDYIPRGVIDVVARKPLAERGHTVAFNPKKASWAPSLIGASLPGIQWRPLVGLDRRGVAELLADTTAYFDPGYHPGRDRMPREAALLGGVTLLARRGAGAYWEDSPIPWEHKVSPGSGFLEGARRALTAVVEDPGAAAFAQTEYREWIDLDRARFSREVGRSFVRGRWEDDSPADHDG